MIVFGKEGVPCLERPDEQKRMCARQAVCSEDSCAVITLGSEGLPGIGEQRS